MRSNLQVLDSKIQLKKEEICAIAQFYYAASFKVSSKKDALVQQLSNLIEKHPGVLDSIQVDSVASGDPSVRSGSEASADDDSTADESDLDHEAATSDRNSSDMPEDNADVQSEMSAEAETEIDTGPACVHCGTKEEDGEKGCMLLCDQYLGDGKMCNAGWHQQCLSPPLYAFFFQTFHACVLLL